MKTGIIVLCRYNSSRLHGKILREIGGKPILSLIIERLQKSQYASGIVIATSNEKSDDPIAEYCESNAINLFRGSLNNVSERFSQCATRFNFDYAVRINGDNLFTDASLIDYATDLVISERFDFVSNVEQRTFPTGMSVEVVKTSFYNRMLPTFKTADYKEHVTLYFYHHPDCGNFRFFYNNSMPSANGLKLAIDCEEDLNFVSLLFQKMEKAHTAYGWKEIVKLATNK